MGTPRVPDREEDETGFDVLHRILDGRTTGEHDPETVGSSCRKTARRESLAERTGSGRRGEAGTVQRFSSTLAEPNMVAASMQEAAPAMM